MTLTVTVTACDCNRDVRALNWRQSLDYCHPPRSPYSQNIPAPPHSFASTHVAGLTSKQSCGRKQQMALLFWRGSVAVQAWQNCSNLVPISPRHSFCPFAALDYSTKEEGLDEGGPSHVMCSCLPANPLRMFVISCHALQPRTLHDIVRLFGCQRIRVRVWSMSAAGTPSEDQVGTTLAHDPISPSRRSSPQHVVRRGKPEWISRA